MVSSYQQQYESIPNNHNSNGIDDDDETEHLVVVKSLHDEEHVKATTTKADKYFNDEEYQYRDQQQSFQVLVVMMACVFGSALLYGYHSSSNNNTRNDAADLAEDGLLPNFRGFFRRNKQAASPTASVLEIHTHNDAAKSIPMPHGVNLGSWLSLEDYFYVGDTGAVEVATPDDNTVGTCLPPLHVGQQGAPRWQSETDLLAHLLETTPSVAHALKVFHAHRTSFVTEHDLQKLSQVYGIKHVRVPLSWCFTDSHPDVDLHDGIGKEDLLAKFTCEDPFYKGVLWPAIPRTLLQNFLKSCAKFGITASLDLHTYPGATSPGTFSGLWPRQPKFWDYDNPELPQEDYGRTLYREFVKWVETLPKEALDGVLGISPMNEPAHLAGVFKDIPSRNYLPPLPEPVAQAYLEELHHSPTIPDGPHLRVFLWLRDAVEVFRGSQLPKLGKQLHVNVHESLLSGDALPPDANDAEGRGNLASHRLIADWWSQTTTADERQDWAVLDMHHYHAWSPSCLGAVDGPPNGNYQCGDVDKRNAALKRCTEWATQIFRPAVDEFCGQHAKLMSGEFSTSTHHRVRHGCNDVETLQTSYILQLQAAAEAEVEMYYWSYKMPFGGAFRSAWSFSELMYLLDVSNQPDESNFHCGGHIPQEGEVTDDFFVAN